jgi:undecaprenyl diphosphate synthase
MSLKHLGIIADGNRRWAKENNLPKIEGHKKGLKTIEELVGAAAMTGVPYITFYVFSTENWGREEAEVDYIMKLAETKILKMAEKMAAITTADKMFGI